MKDLAIALCRVSTPEQRLSNSLTRQEESIKKLAETLDVEVVKVISGDVSSKFGRNLNRPDLNEAYNLCRTNRKIKFLLIDEVDRLGRSQAENWLWLARFELELKVAVRFASNPQWTINNSADSLLISIDNFKAQGSNEERQRKSINGHVAAINQGRYTFPPKPGYTKGTEPGVHVPHPITFIPLQTAFREVLSGLYSPTEALKRLMASEFNTVYKRWNMDKFRHFATDPYYAGILVVDRQVQAKNNKGLHEPMITPAEHEKLVQILNGTLKLRGHKKQYNPDFPMNKVLTCEDCGGEVKFTGAKGHNGFTRKTKNGCTPRAKVNYYWKYRCRGCGKAYHRQKVHDLLTERISEIQYTGNQKNDFIEALETVWRQRQQDKLQEVKTLQKRLNELQETKSKLVVEMVTADPSIKEDIRAELDKIKVQITDLEQQISGSSELEQDMTEFVRFGLNYTDDLMEDWWDLSHEDRVWCQKLVFRGGIMFNSQEKVSTPDISPLYSLKPIKKDLSSKEKSLLVELVGTAPTSDW